MPFSTRLLTWILRVIRHIYPWVTLTAIKQYILQDSISLNTIAQDLSNSSIDCKHCVGANVLFRERLKRLSLHVLIISSFLIEWLWIGLLFQYHIAVPTDLKWMRLWPTLKNIFSHRCTIYRDRWYLLTPIYFGKNKSCGPTVYELTLFIASRLRSTLSTFQKSVDSGLHSDFPKNVDSGLHFFYNFMQH